MPFRAISEKRRRLAHVVAGAVILIHAWEKLDGGHDSWRLFAIAGIVFIGIALFHHRLEKNFPWIDGVFFVIEGMLSLAVAYDYFHLGKKALPYCYLGLGVMQFAIAFIRSKKGIERHTAAP